MLFLEEAPAHCLARRLKKKFNLWLMAPKGATPVTRLLQLTGRWQYDGIMWLARKIFNKINFADFKTSSLECLIFILDYYIKVLWQLLIIY